jgi:hypothetical protein
MKTMALVTSLAGLEGINIQKPNTTSRTGSSSSTPSFQSIYTNKIQSGSESMDAIFEEASARFDVPVNLLKAVAKAESGFNPNAVSKAGAIGVMQLMPATARSLGVADPYDARQNIMGGAKYIKQNLDRFNGNVSLALAAYNAGPDAVNRYGGIPPYEETQNYVRVVNSYMGTPISTGKTVTASNNGSASIYSRLLGGSSSAYVSLLNGDSQTSASSKLAGIYGTSYGDLANAYGIGSSMNTMGMLLGSASMSEDGETITLSKESYVSLIQMLQLQMMMNASREVGSISI